MATQKNTVPQIESSKWNHGSVKSGVVFTAKTETEVLISHEDIFKTIKEDGASNVLTSVLNSMAKAFNTDFGNFALGLSLDDIEEDTKDWLVHIAEWIKENN